jgi:hypothetical protein
MSGTHPRTGKPLPSGADAERQLRTFVAKFDPEMQVLETQVLEYKGHRQAPKLESALHCLRRRAVRLCHHSRHQYSPRCALFLGGAGFTAWRSDRHVARESGRPESAASGCHGGCELRWCDALCDGGGTAAWNETGARHAGCRIIVRAVHGGQLSTPCSRPPRVIAGTFDT